MQSNRDYEHDLAAIRAAMERSAKFLSLSGLSGVLAGMYALAGASIAYFLYFRQPPGTGNFREAHLAQLLGIAIVVLCLSLATGFFMSLSKARKLGLSISNHASRAFLISLFVPLVAGGLFIAVVLFKGYAALAVPACLLFYGLALFNASSFTVREIKYLAYSEMLLGLLAAVWPAHGLLFWAIGFGVLHIIYGLVVYYRYDREKSL
jgi:hypothetical protein